jgi:peroxiredoxin Q/BCP
MLQIGDKAPDFELKDQNEKNVKLSDFKGKKIALYFYPKDNTPGCTAQACNLRDNIEELNAKGIIVIGISIDNIKNHQKFIEKQQLNFTLLADEEKNVVNLYQVWGPKQFMGKNYEGTHRVTFLINEKGIIEHIIDKVKTKEHAQQILEIWSHH